VLKSIGTMLVEIHGQHDDRALVEAATHRVILDAYGGLQGEGRAVADAAQCLRQSRSALAEHRARVDDAPGYEVRFRSGSTFGSDLLLVPGDDEERGALLVSLRRDVRGRPKLSASEEEFADLAMQAMRSITYTAMG